VGGKLAGNDSGTTKTLHHPRRRPSAGDFKREGDEKNAKPQIRNQTQEKQAKKPPVGGDDNIKEGRIHPGFGKQRRKTKREEYNSRGKI